MPEASLSQKSPEQKLSQLLNPSHDLCRDDVVWILEYVKKKVAERDPRLLGLSQPRLLANFQYFAQIALMLIHRRSQFDNETDRIKLWVSEATYGLNPE